MRFTLLVLGLVFCSSAVKAQTVACKGMSIYDPRLPLYPPIARAAHMEGIIRFKIHPPESGTAQVKFLDGPNNGAFGILVSAAQKYAEARQYGWLTEGHHDACDYILAVQFKVIGQEVDPPNNFLRVTVIDEFHTLVEVKPTKPTVNY